MRLSISVTNFSWRGEPLAGGLSRIAEAADRGGLHGVWVADHLLQADPYGARPGESEMLEAYTTLGFLAARTERVRLGTMVSAVTFRPPALLVKAVSTLDVLSGGRALFGVGAGYLGDEATAMGLPLPAVGERFDRLEETLRIARQMWAGDQTPFVGTHHRLERPEHSPATLSRPHPPILIGGTGERRTLPLVARYADACNLFDIPDGGATARHKLAVLQRLCTEAARPFDAIEKTISTRLAPGESTTSFVERCRAFADLGIDHVCVITTGPWTEDAVAVLGAAVPGLAGLERHGPAG
ncbi:TIGR03560 family F420-dependent LLM class oxidoreductase [Pseudonocardia sp. C8]|uniref:TIGR03560 family F420-dependent LLM class oxidoreductase n=1 Tax=Pseudonocardia sp. C8 TaxID=2762759 RepID=UPI001643470E|nr:TIGR03560 family F420-dependent LLM class oxidoreductase [Pseudonocardia sp. C8]MBC3192133.1 TIGR03560 family F420-dependent LLM class oxidoreductase [Pseudonocardia sp. C8]